MDVNSLLSPPEAKRQEPFMASSARQNHNPPTFFNSEEQQPSNSKFQPPVQSRLPLSPPISPYTTAPKHNASYSPQSSIQRDPQLFPEAEEDDSVAIDPLFLIEQASIEAVADDHMARRKQQVVARYRPTKEEYQTMAGMVSTVVKQMQRNPIEWVRREREYLDRRYAGHPSKVDKKQRTGGYRKIAPKKPKAAAGPKKEKPQDPIPKVPRVARTPRPTPKAQALESFTAMSTSAPKAPRQPTTRDDIDYNSVPDMTPSLATLADNSKAMKIDWRGHPRDLSLDPDRHLLHEAEIQLAGILRLSCAQYLTAKRKIFIARVNCEKIGKEFRKTDAQQACKIDVNKASKLWVAFDKVGWLERSLIQRFL